MLCIFTDASDHFYGIMLSQIPIRQVDNAIWEQQHSPVAFISGNFTSSQKNWSTIEKEAYPIVLAMKKLQHFLSNPRGFRLFTDHRNLVFVFSPSGTKKASTDRLLRWSDLISSFRFVVEHIPGSYNVWADILSRWKSMSVQSPILASINIRTPTTLEDFSWPSMDCIRVEQHRRPDQPSGLTLDGDIFRKKGKIWVPTQDLRTRIIIIGHCSISGHRGGETTLKLFLVDGLSKGKPVYNHTPNLFCLR
jgi:hypothetical protein